MGSFAAVDAKASKPNGKDSTSVELSESQKAALARITDAKKREKLRNKMLEAKRRETAQPSAADTKAVDADKATFEEASTSVTVSPSQQTVDVKAPAFTVNLPQTNVSIQHAGMTWGQIGTRLLGWVQTFIVGAAAWALFGDGVLRAFGH